MKKIFWLIALALLASCVTNKKVMYLQKDDVNKKNLPTDSLMRTYQLGKFDYKIQPEDIIAVRVESLTPEEFDIYNRPGSSSSSTNQNQAAGTGNFLLMGDLVDKDGNIPFILSGKVKVGGMNIYQVQDTLQHIANLYLKSAIVRARLLNFRVTLLGEVNKEGQVTVNNNRVSIFETIALAGGLSELADRADVKLIRQESGVAKVYYINLLKEDFFNSPLYYSQQSDIIMVPPLRQRTYRKYFTSNLALFLSSLSLILIVVSYTK